MRKLKIAFTASLFLRGGAEQRAANLMNSLLGKGHEVELVAGNRVEWLDVRQTKVCGLRMPVLSSVLRVLDFFRVLAAKRYDVIVAGCYLSALGAVLARKFTGTPVVRISYGPDPGHLSPAETGIKHGIIRYSYRKSDAVVTPSKWAHDYVKRVFDTESEIIPIGIDLRRFQTKMKPVPKDSLGTSKKDTIILYVGHMLKRKGLDDLLDAAFQIGKVHRDVRFVFIGNSWHREEIERKRKLVKDKGIDKNVVFLGEVDNRKLPGYYKACDIFCLPSWEESFGIVFLEAMAMGKPIVATKTSAIPGVVREGVNGLLVGVNQPEKLALALEKLIENKDLRERLGRKGREIVEREFDIEKEAGTFSKLFYSLVE